MILRFLLRQTTHKLQHLPKTPQKNVSGLIYSQYFVYGVSSCDRPYIKVASFSGKCWLVLLKSAIKVDGNANGYPVASTIAQKVRFVISLVVDLCLILLS